MPRASRDVEFVHVGMPTGASLLVWPPQKRADWLAECARRWEAIGPSEGKPDLAERNVAREKRSAARRRPA